MCVTQVWADTYAIVFKTSSSDGNTTIASNTAVTNVVAEGTSYVSGFTSSNSKAYHNSKSGVKLGSSSAGGTFVLNIATSYQANIKSITIKSVKYGSDDGTLTLYSGSTSLKTGITPGNDYTHTFETPTTVSSIKVTSTKRAYVSQIILETGSTNPAVSVSGDLISFTYAAGDGPSANQSFTVSGSNLTANLVVTAPSGYEVCKTADGSYASSISYTQSDGSVASTTAYIRLKSGLSQGTYNGNITVSSTRATNQTKAVEGSVTAAVAKYTVTWHIGSRTQTTLNVPDQTAFSSLSAPEVEDDAAGSCANKFMGWATSAISGTTDAAGFNAKKVTGDTKVTSTCKDFHAVFATQSGKGYSELETVGFESGEGYTAATTYNSSSYTNGSKGSKWTINYGAFATSGAIVGSQSAQFRIYSSGGGYGQLRNTVAYASDITKVVFSAKAANASGQVKVSYSSNGSSWTDIKTISLTTTTTEYTETISASGIKYIKFTAAGTKPGSGNYSIYVDAIKLYSGSGSTYTDYLTSCVSCDEDPTVGDIMNVVSAISATGATFSTSSGVSAGTNCHLTEVGFVYGTSANPTIGGSGVTKVTIDGYTSGNLNKAITGLTASTTYHVRAYATNGHGTTYSDEKSFSTLKAISSIAIKTVPTKTTYFEGENFAPAGLVITVNYTDASKEDVAYSGHESNFTFLPTTSTALQTSNTQVQITYGGKTCNQTITVNAIALTGFTIKTVPTKLNYIENEKFDPTGLVITASYNNGSKSDVAYADHSGDFAFDPSTSTSLTPAGNKNVTITYGTKNQTQAINVYTFNSTSSDVNLGKISRSGSTITMTLQGCGTYGDPVYTINSGAATLRQGTGVNANKLYVDGITANTTVTVNFVEQTTDQYIDQVHSLPVSGNFCGTYAAPVLSDQSAGEGCIGTHLHFAGWSTNGALVSAGTPGGLITSGTSMTANGTTYYAVWSEAVGGGYAPSSTKKTSLAVGDKVYMALGYDDDGVSGQAMNDATVSGEKSNWKLFTVATKVTGEDDANLRLVTDDDDYVRYSGGKYVYWHTDESGNPAAFTTDANGYVVCNSTYYLYRNSTSEAVFYRFYADKSSADDKANYSHFYFYAATGGVTYGNYITACANTVDITYNGNGNTSGSAPATTTVSQGDNATLRTNTGSLAKTGYTLTGWNTASAGNGTHYDLGGTMSDVQSDIEIFAEWTINKHSVTFDVDGGSVVAAMSNINYNTDVDISGKTSNKTGYDFGGWTVTSGGVSIVSNHFTMQDADVVLTAIWTPKQYTVSFNKHEGSNGDNSVTATYDAAMPNIVVPTRDGYKFMGYFANEGGSGTQYYSKTGTSVHVWDVDGATTLHAHWVVRVYDTYKDLYHSTADQEMDEDGYTIPSIADRPSGDHMYFLGWATEANKLSPAGHVIEAGGTTDPNGTTYYAVWANKEGNGTYDAVEYTESSIANGMYIIACTVSSTEYAALYGSANAAISKTTSFIKQNITTAQITGSTGLKYIWSVSDGSSAKIIKNVYTANGTTWWYPNVNSNDIQIQSTQTSEWTFTKVTGGWNIYNGTKYWQYDSGTKATFRLTGGETKLTLYKLVPNEAYSAHACLPAQPHAINRDNEEISVETGITEALAGVEVTFTVQDKAGYTTGTPTVDKSVGTCSLTDLGSNTYKFTMPDEDVTINAVYSCNTYNIVHDFVPHATLGGIGTYIETNNEYKNTKVCGAELGEYMFYIRFKNETYRQLYHINLAVTRGGGAWDGYTYENEWFTVPAGALTADINIRVTLTMDEYNATTKTAPESKGTITLYKTDGSAWSNPIPAGQTVYMDADPITDYVFNNIVGNWAVRRSSNESLNAAEVHGPALAGSNTGRYYFTMPKEDVVVIATVAAGSVDTYIDEMHGTVIPTSTTKNTYTVPLLENKTTGSVQCETDHLYFIGWTTTSSGSPVQNPSEMTILPGGVEKIADGTTYYAVWATAVAH